MDEDYMKQVYDFNKYKLLRMVSNLATKEEFKEVIELMTMDPRINIEPRRVFPYEIEIKKKK